MNILALDLARQTGHALFLEDNDRMSVEPELLSGTRSFARCQDRTSLRYSANSRTGLITNSTASKSGTLLMSWLTGKSSIKTGASCTSE